MAQDRFTEAEAEFAARVPMTHGEWSQLTESARAQAFTVAGLEQLAMVQWVYDSIADAMANGTVYSEWAKAVRQKLPQLPAARLPVVYRNAIQTAYNRGRYRQMTSEPVLRRRPYWMFDAILDSRTTNICSSLDGTVEPAGSQFWATRIPPLHHQCRSSIRALSARQAARKRRFGEAAPATQPASGFGLAPDLALEPIQIDASRYDSQLWAEYQRKPEPAKSNRPKP